MIGSDPANSNQRDQNGRLCGIEPARFGVLVCRRAELLETVRQYALEPGLMLEFTIRLPRDRERGLVVDALQNEPQLNSRLDGDELVQNHFYDIGVAVGTERGLIVPVIRDADRKTFSELENDLAYYAKKAREGAITIEDLQGGVFTISNGGVYGSLLSTPILNPPQSGILGMHKIQERPVAVDGKVVIRPMMYLALSYDHRVVDGREAVTFLLRVKEAMENPVRLFLGDAK